MFFRKLWFAIYIVILISVYVFSNANATELLSRVERSHSKISIETFALDKQVDLRKWVQLTWNKDQRRLERLVLQAADMLKNSDYNMSWVAKDNNKTGVISGDGKLTWRVLGAIGTDPTAIIAKFTGTLVDGRADGIGHFYHVSGFEYQGGWRFGVPNGKGRLKFTNGDEYFGEFNDGQLDKFGTYVDASGAVYDGGFSNGKREGSGTVYLPGKPAFVARWHNGVIIKGSESELSSSDYRFPILTVSDDFDRDENISINVVSDRAWARKRNEGDYKVVDYDSRSEGETLMVFVGNKRLRDAWKGTGDILVRTEDAHSLVEKNEGFLGQSDTIIPVPFLFQIENSSNRPIGIEEVYIQVNKSNANLAPAIHVLSAESEGFNECAPDPVSVDLMIQDFGWGKTDEISIDYKIRNTPISGTKEILNLTDFPSEISLVGDFEDAGLDFDFLSEPYICDLIRTDCFNNLIKRKVFGKISDSLVLGDDGFVYVTLDGKINVKWREKGEPKTRKMPFSSKLPVAFISAAIECGEGGDRSIGRTKPFEFRVDGENYQIALPIQDTLNSRVAASWRVEVEAPRSSDHEFRVVFALEDGRRLASRPVKLEYFKPKTLKYEDDEGLVRVE